MRLELWRKGDDGLLYGELPADIGTNKDARERVMDEYKADLLSRISKSRDKLSEAEKAYKKSQEAGEGWRGGLAKGLGAFADTMAGMAGQKGGYTAQAMGSIKDQKKEGREAYKEALASEGEYLKEYDAMGKRELDSMILKDKIASSNPESKESAAARDFAKELGLNLPEDTNAIQAKVYIDQFLKKKKYESDEDWKQRNYEQRESSYYWKTIRIWKEN